MGVVRATDSKNLTREGFCKLLVKIVNDTTGTFKTEYATELSKYLKGIHPFDIANKYALNVAIDDKSIDSSVTIEIPSEFLPKKASSKVVQLFIQNPIADLKFNIKEKSK